MLGYCHNGTKEIHWALVESVSVYHEEVAWSLGGGLFGRQSFDSDLPLNTQISLDKLFNFSMPQFLSGMLLGECITQNLRHRSDLSVTVFFLVPPSSLPFLPEAKEAEGAACLPLSSQSACWAFSPGGIWGWY